MIVERIIELLDIVSDFDDFELRSWQIKDLRLYGSDIEKYHDVSKVYYSVLLNELENFGTHMELIEVWGGEDEGSDYGVIFGVGPYFFKNVTTYASHCGIDDWHGTKQVFPRTIEKIIYEDD